MDILKRFDVHPKLVQDFVVRTKTGALVSIVAILLAVVLFIGELRQYLSIETAEFMEVDTIRGTKMRINFDVTFPSLPCAAVSLDAMDASGAHQLDILHDIFKRRLDPTGASIGDSVKEVNRGTLKSAGDLLKEKERAIAEGRPASPADKVGTCGDCYGAGVEGQCCNTCEEVRILYRAKGWSFNMATVEQCKQEGWYGDVKAQIDGGEGCNIYGHMEVPKVQGNMHFAPTHAVQHAYAHVNDLVGFTISNFNISHRINALSFGAYSPLTSSPVNGLARTVIEGAGMHQYFIKLVPVQFTPLGASAPQHSYKFSVTEHLRVLDRAAGMDLSGGAALPGVFFNYELSPIRVRAEERPRSFLHFLTRVCAIIGGVFTIMGVVDRLVEGALAGVAAKRRAQKRGGGGLMD